MTLSVQHQLELKPIRRMNWASQSLSLSPKIIFRAEVLQKNKMVAPELNCSAQWLGLRVSASLV